MTTGLEHLDARELGELRMLFFAQAGEQLDQVQEALLGLERDGAAPETLRSIKRALHTIKGDATSMGFEGPGHLCHRLEDVLAAVATDPGRAAAAVAILFAGADALGNLLVELQAGRDGSVPAELTARIDNFLDRGAAAEAGAALTERERLEACEALQRGLELFDVEITLDPGCRESQVGALMVRERLRQVATVIAVRPDPERPASANAPGFRFLVAAAAAEPVAAAARLAGVVARAVVLPGATTAADLEGSATPRAVTAGVEPGSERREVLRVDAAKVDAVLDLVGELIVGRSMIDQAVRDAESAAPGAEFVERLRAASAAFERTVGDLQKGALRMRMVPLRFLFKKFPRVVRDLAHQLGKEVRLEIEGQDTELDKGIVDALFEPLNHLVRNMVDHGIETPEARLAAGKAAEGLITLRAYQEAARIVVEVVDDGRGIDTEKLVRRAVERGCVSTAAAASLAPEEALRLVLLPGVSTADEVSETSGRGVGMDVVKSAMDAVKGSVDVESRAGAGTCFRLRLPMTLAVIRTLLFDAGGRMFALPVAAIAEVGRVRPGELASVDGRPCLQLRDRLVSVIPLDGLFGGAAAEGDGRFVLVLALRGRRFGLLVERLRWQQELVIKSVDERWIDAGVIAGASILGDGRVVLILDAAAVVARAVEREKAGRAAS